MSKGTIKFLYEDIDLYDEHLNKASKEFTDMQAQAESQTEEIIKKDEAINRKNKIINNFILKLYFMINCNHLNGMEIFNLI